MTPPRPDRILELASAYWDSCALLTAAELGLFSAVGDGATADDIAAAVGLDGRTTGLLLNALVAVGLLTKDGETFANTSESAAYLVRGKPGDLSTALKYNADVYPAWGRLAELVTTGTPVEAPAIHLGDDPARTERFVRAMDGRARAIGRAVVPLLDLTGCSRLLDAAGGPGTYSVLLAERHPELHCTVLDLPGVVAVAEKLVTQSPAADRIDFLPGDYHTADFPGDQDAVLFFGCLHQESPASIVDLLTRAHAALNPGGRVFVMDMMTDATRTAPRFSAMFALNMALTTNDGWVFSDADLTAWLTQAGFTEPNLTPLPPPMPHWLVSSVKT